MSLQFEFGRRDQEAPPGFEPGMKVLQTSSRHAATRYDTKGSLSINDRLSLSLPLTEEISAELIEIMDAWAWLPESLRANILAMVRDAPKKTID